MISGSKIESPDFYVPSRGYRILFQSNTSKIRPKSPSKKTVKKSLSQRKITKKLHSVEEESLLMQYHSINIEKLPKRIKIKFQTLHSKLDGVLELI